MRIKKINLIDEPKKEFSMSNSDMASIIGGSSDYCPGTYQDGGWFGDDYCSASYSSGSCGDADDYCGSYTSCTLKLSSK